MSSSTLKSLAALGGFLAVSFSAAVLASASPPGAWYETLAKPSWNPPSWVFGPVWTLLYIMIAVAAWRIWLRGADRVSALGAWGVQMVLNALWSWLFFGLQRPDLAFAEICLLWLTIVVTLVLFWRRERLAGALLVPYLVWVSFAALLNFTLWQLNP
ncbi:MAG: TspO/MBR family protein [Acidobacteriota bacterium]